MYRACAAQRTRGTGAPGLQCGAASQGCAPIGAPPLRSCLLVGQPVQVLRQPGHQLAAALVADERPPAQRQEESRDALRQGEQAIP
jgi:hypothetical protein